MHTPSLLLTLLASAAICPAQVTATYDTFGSGCPGTGLGLGGTHVLPAVATTAWGSGNAIPFGWTPNRYQQVFLGSELPNASTLAALSLRQPHTGAMAHNFAVDLDVKVGYTTRWLPTLSTTFASNWDAGAPVLVLPRTVVDFPDQVAYPQSPTEMLMTIPWQATFDWTPLPGRNLLIEVTVYGNSQGSGVYGYPIDNLNGTVSLWGTPESSPIATGGLRSFGLVMGFVERDFTAAPQLFSTDTPQIGNQFRVRVAQAAPSSLALMAISLSTGTWNGQPLPLSLGTYGAPGCSLLIDPFDTRILFTSAAGTTNLQYSIPNNIYGLGLPFYNQAVVAEPTVNPLGLVTTNGGAGVIGNQ